MHAQNLLTHLDELSPDAATRWVAAALAEAAALRAHDDQLYPPANDGGALEAAGRLHESWRGWADDAESLLDRLRQIGPGAQSVAGITDLEYAVGRARAMLKLAPESMNEAREQVRRGEVYSAEEVRRELGLKSHR